jgi:predicted XRE-type DNA-binding protein
MDTENPETIEKLNEVKMQLCLEIKRSFRKNRWDQREAARNLKTSRSCMHHVDALKVEKLTVNQLFKYLARAEPNFEILIALK